MTFATYTSVQAWRGSSVVYGNEKPNSRPFVYICENRLVPAEIVEIKEEEEI